MPWFRVDDGFSDHPKVKAIPRRRREAACGLWVLAGSWSAAKLTEGFIPVHMIPELGGSPSSVDALVSVRLWEQVDGGYQFHDWTSKNPTKLAVEAEREAAAKRQREARERARSRRESLNGHGVTVPPQTDASQRDKGVSHGPPDPTRPDPYQKTKTPPDASRRPPTTGTRIPDDFAPDDQLLAWVREKCPDVPRSEHDAFIDYWRAQPGAKGRKADWPATWRNWMRRAQADIATGHRFPAKPRSTTDERAAQGLALVEHFSRIENGAQPTTLRAIGGTA